MDPEDQNPFMEGDLEPKNPFDDSDLYGDGLGDEDPPEISYDPSPSQPPQATTPVCKI